MAVQRTMNTTLFISVRFSLDRQASLVYCNSQLNRFHRLFSPFQTRPTWAYPTHYVPAFASSAIPRLLLPPCLAVRVTTTSVLQASSFSMFCIHHRRI